MISIYAYIESEYIEMKFKEKDDEISKLFQELKRLKNETK